MTQFRRFTVIFFRLLVGIVIIASCASPGRYTSLDLALLPCENDLKKFFNPLEFKADGSYLYPKQKTRLESDLRNGALTDLVIFIHGWNKTPLSAEIDYQNFICRLHSKLPTEQKDSKREGHWQVLGVFWPSTISNKAKEPFLIKPISYYRIRNRVDHLATTGFSELLREIGETLIEMDVDRNIDNRIRLHLIGHSFGGRMIIRSFKKLSDDNQLVPLLLELEATNVLLINAAAPPSFFAWIVDAVAQAWKLEQVARFTPETSSYLLNIHSWNDSANKYLFRFASVFNSDEVSCAVGACGIPKYPTLFVNDAGELIPPDDAGLKCRPKLNIRNIDSTSTIFNHSDIYKGRVANLISDLLYNKSTRELLRSQTTDAEEC